MFSMSLLKRLNATTVIMQQAVNAIENKKQKNESAGDSSCCPTTDLVLDQQFQKTVEIIGNLNNSSNCITSSCDSGGDSGGGDSGGGDSGGGDSGGDSGGD